MVYGIWLAILGILGASNLIIARKPDAKEMIAKLARSPRGLTTSSLVGVLQQDHVGLAARLTHAGDVDRRLVLHRAHLLARAAADAQVGVDVRPLHVHGGHRRRGPVGAGGALAL